MNEVIEEIPIENVTPSEPACECKKCKIQREIDTLQEIACTCTYHDVEKTETYIDEAGTEQLHTYTVREVETKCIRCVGIDSFKTTLDNYYILEEANINEDVWDLCTIIDGVIYTPTLEGTISNSDRIWDTLEYLTKPV